jgi:membrane protein YdbS with pleckstrin-like domain
MPKHLDLTRPTTGSRDRTKACPFCAETIRHEAVKCRFCGEFLYGDRQETAAKLGPPPADPEADPEKSDQGAEEEDDLLWYGRPSLLALMGTYVKMGIFIALCGAVHGYRVTAVVPWLGTYATNIKVSPERLAQVEGWLDVAALGLIGAAVLALIWKMIALKSIYYEVTPDRIEWSRGIFDRKMDNLDMFRVIDLKLRRSLLECLLGIGTVQLTTKDDSDPHFDFVKVHDCRYLYDVIKQAGLEADRKRGVIHLE